MLIPPYRTVLIDDEPLAIRRLREMLDGYTSQFDIVGEATNGQEGLDLIELRQPDLLFLDIEMPLLNGFQLASQLSFHPVIVFVTAYDQYAIQAFEENSIDYLLKPVEKERLDKTVNKLRFMNERPTLAHFQRQLTQLLTVPKPEPSLTVVPVRIGDRTLLIRLDEVSYFEAEDRYVNLFTREGRKHLIDYSLATLEEKLPSHFFRASRSTIVNQQFIREVAKYFTGRYVLSLDDQPRTRITTGLHYADRIKKLMNW